MMTNLIVIEYTQSITYDESNQPKETMSVSVRLAYEAFSSGWIKKNFRGRSGPTDFLVLTGIANHARPLHGDDLQQMIDLGVATRDDEGRLYARVTDVGLADELGMERHTVSDAAARLGKKHLIHICPLPDDFRDSRGQFNGVRAYIITGTFVTKQYGNDSAGLAHIDGAHRGSLSTTDDVHQGVHRGSLSTTDDVHQDVHRGGLSTTDGAHRGTLTATNIDDEDEDEILLNFLNRLIEPRSATPRERQQLRTLLDEGYTCRQIGEAIDAVFQRQDADHPIRQFGRVMTYMHKHIPQLSSSGATSGRQHTEPSEVSDAPQTVDGAAPTDTTRCAVAVSSEIDAILTQAGYDQANIRLSIHGLMSGSDPTLSPPATTHEVVTALWAAIGAGIQSPNLRSYLCTVIRNGRNAPAPAQSGNAGSIRSSTANAQPVYSSTANVQPTARGLTASGLIPPTQRDMDNWSQVVGHACMPSEDGCDIVYLTDDTKHALRQAEVGRRNGSFVVRVDPVIYAAIQPFMPAIERYFTAFFVEESELTMEELI